MLQISNFFLLEQQIFTFEYFTNRRMNVTIRKGNINDCQDAFELIKELALYEKAPEEVINTAEQMKKDGFGANPLFEFYVGEIDHKIIGIALFYIRYSTWKGPCLYLEDIVVKEQFRGNKVGKKLFDKVLEHAKNKDFAFLYWQVLDWNEPAFNFYKKYPASFDDTWVNGKIDVREIKL